MTAAQARIQTRLVHAGSPELTQGAGPVNVPVVRTSTVRFADTATQAALAGQRAAGERVATYGRHGLDTHQALEEAVASLEGGYRSLLAPSGLSAIVLVLLATLAPGDHALVSDGVYSPVRKVDRALLQRYGIEVEYFSAARDALEPLIRPNTRLLYLESPSSLLYEVLDLPALAAVARRHGVLVAADNTWSGGLYYQPLALGAHISLQAATKYLAGHSDVMMGVVTVDGPDLARQLGATADALGLAVGADDAYLTLRGLRTLDVRLARHHENALGVAEYLAGQPDVASVYYPALAQDPGHELWRRDYSGASGLVSFAFRHPEPAAASHFIDALRYFSIGASWGGYESLALEAAPERLAEHGAWREGGHARQSVVRLHIGLESPLDLIEDLERAFGATRDALRRSA
ncbi:Cystathionine beta-lyase [Achromobacter denitrificans]|uniref:cystathionine beta-lyase n=1 Tax=Achromobacter denitrificans TaxID=32002 RepID=UPI0007874C3D|nr:cystathionine beta-lyase [Achromobacter denitrificans]OLU05037.1 cystathionine beta-lyase [Achromobacter denitrificans]QKH41032.1 cystathionine beta-lyase [Achromobacter denitrificans]QKH51822.1 cystathionine beta-lyase [Achromobacter denitrificans]CAB3715136.1 Cystathionine beta-lyase [Achromobacter denitrificans]SUU28443.1 Cystathionine beta-lyase [Achromobacter denitrificans]